MPVQLDETGIEQCRTAATAGWAKAMRSCAVSAFPRTFETAELTLSPHILSITVEPRLNEIDYGDFEGGPWLRYGRWLEDKGRHAIPPGGRESLHLATTRLLHGIASSMALPAPRLVVAHGHLVSMLRELARPGGTLNALALPPAPYVTPLIFSDSRLASLIDLGHRELDRLCPEVTAHDPAL